MKVQEISSGIGPSKDKTETQFYQHQHQYQYSKSNSKCSNTSMASSFNSAYYSADQLAGVLSSKPSNVEDKTGISTGPKHDNNSYKNNDGSKSSDNCSNDNNRKRMDTTFTSTSTSTDKDMFPIDQHPEYKILMSKLKRSDDRVQILDEENYTLQMNVSELTTRLEQAEKTHRKERVAATKRGQAEKNYLIQQMAEKQKANEVLELQVKRLKAQVQRLGKEKKVVEDELCSLEKKLAELQNSSAINNTNKQIVGVYNNNNGNDNGVTGATGMERMDSVLDITKQQQQQQQLEQELQDEQDIKNYQKRLVQLRRGNSYRTNQINGANVCKEKPRRRKNTINSPRRGMRLRSITGESSLCSNVVQKSLDEDGVDGVDEWQDEEQDVEKMLSKQLAISMLEDTNNNNKNDDDNDNENENDNINNNNNSLDSEGGIYQRVNKSIEEGEEYTNLEIEMKKAIFQHSKVLKRTGNSMRQKGGMMRMKRVVEYSEKQTQTEDQNQDQNQKEEIEVEVENSGDKDSSIMTIQTATDSDIAIVMVGQNANANANTNANVNVNKFKTKYAAKSKQLLMLDNTSYEFVPTKKVIEREINKYKRDFNVPQTNTTAKNTITTTTNNNNNNNNNNASRPVSIPSINIKSSSNSSYSSNSVIDKVDINIKTAEKQMGNRFSRISNSQHATLLKSLVKTSYSTSLLAKKNNAHINNYNNNNNDNNDSKQKVIDPKIVNVLSKVMMGTYMYKFSTNSSSSSSNGNNENNMYYFTVHPYSKTLSWAKQPMNESQKGIKTMYIDSVRVVADYQTSKYLDLCSYSLIISDSKNQVKIKASNAEDHDSWYLALSYLQSRRPKSSF